MMTVPFLAVLFAAGVLAWLADVENWSDGQAFSGAVVAGLGSGMFLGALT